LNDAIWGAGNTPVRYLLLLLGYGALFVLVRAISPRLAPEFRARYLALGVGWALGTFFANYGLYRLGFMSFLPWANDFAHTFLWIGLVLGWLYGGVYQRSPVEQFALFAIFSFIVKAGEHALLGTWELDHFFFIPGNAAYVIGWSLADGLYPALSAFGLNLLARRIPSLRLATGGA